MAQCAACLQPITRGEQFALDGTEVFHRACVRQAYRSKLKIAEQSVRDLEARLADTRTAAARVEAEANLHRSLARQHHGDLTRVTAEAQRNAQEVYAERGYRLEAERALAAVAAERDGLRRELAAERAANRPQPEEKPTEDLDATSQRFRMLELD